MADYSTRPATRLGAALVVLLALVAVPLQPTVAAPTEHPDALTEWAEGAPDRFLYWAQQTASPELVEALQLVDPGGRFILNLPWDDMTGDGLDDVMAIDLDFGPDGMGFTGISSKLTVLDGRSGDVLWAREFEDQPAFPAEARLGPKARNGVVVLTIDPETYATVFIGLDHRGRELYKYSFASDGTSGGTAEEVVSFALQNSLEGRATEVLVGLSSVTRTIPVDPAVPSLVARTRTAVIDGKTGTLVEHPDLEIGVGRVPIPLTAPDLDGDGLQDHVVTYVLPDVEYDEESGLPLVPELEEELVRGRRGVDGTRLWTSAPLDLADDWDDPPISAELALGDQTRDGHDEVLLVLGQHGYINSDFEYVYPSSHRRGVWSLNGRNGDVVWHRPVSSAVVVEDLDGDRRRDVLLVDPVDGDKRSGTRITGASGLDARRIYSRFFRVDRDDDQRVYADLWSAGDLQPDGVSDFILDQTLRRDFANGVELALIRNVLFSGADGRRLQGLGMGWPLGASVDGRGDDLYRWRGTSPNEVAVADGTSGRTLVEAALDIPLTLPTDVDYLIPIPARLDRDRCADFVGTFENSRSTFAVAIDGGTGRLLWAKRQQGPDLGGPVTQTRRVDTNRAC